jgi:hypothetical protein
VPLRGNLAVAGRSPGRWDFSHASEPGSKGSTPYHYRASVAYRASGGASESSPSVNPLQGNLGVATG